jgi:hypothetical protein
MACMHASSEQGQVRAQPEETSFFALKQIRKSLKIRQMAP